MNDIRNIAMQTLGVSHKQKQHAGEALVYAPGAMLEEIPDPDLTVVDIKALLVRRQIEAIREAVIDLSWRARLGKEREGEGVEQSANQLAEMILPDGSFDRILAPSVNPQFLIEQDLASEIPWEVLPSQVGADTKLAVERHLSHRVRGGKPPAAEHGDRFLMVIDPTENTCTDSVDPDGTCRDHVGYIRSRVEQAGFQVRMLKKHHATVARMKTMLQDPDFVGLYFFGHGYFPEEAGEGCLAMADGPLLASEIRMISPNIRFVFLNACESASGSKSWSIERKSGSVGEMFGRGGPEKSVVAPLFPVVNVQAAQAGRTFFEHAFDSSVAGAVRAIRLESLDAYQRDQPNISWMAYRLFGDPRRQIPVPNQLPSSTSAPKRSRVFGRADGSLDPDVFSFDIRQILLHAAMHREARGAQQVDIEDIIAALIEYGHLTRYVLYALEIDPKVVLARPGLFSERIREVIQRHKSIDESDEEVDQDVLTELQAMAMSYTVRERDAFSEHLAEVFLRADRLCGSDRSQRKITEEDVLRSVCDCERWVWPVRPQSSGRMQLVELPDSQELLTWLNQPLEDRGVDADGGVVLLDLDSDAQQIIDSAHRQSQQRGLSTIPFRLLLAAFLGEPKGFVSGLCQRHGIDARGLADLLIATTNADSPSTFALTHEVCNRAVLPVLSVARAYNHEGLLSEAHLFRALCEIAPSDLTKVIRNDLPNKLCADLEQLGEETTSYLRRQAETDESSQPANDGMGESRSRRLEDIPFDKRLDSVILAASQIALTQGYLQIRTPHLLIALIAYGRGSVRAAFQQGPLSLDQLVIGLLSAVPPQALTERPSGKPQFGPSVQALWDKTLRDYLAHSQAAHSRAADSRASETTERPRLDEVHLLTKMLADSTAPIVTILHQLGYQAVIQRWQSKYGDGGLHRE